MMTRKTMRVQGPKRSPLTDVTRISPVGKSVFILGWEKSGCQLRVDKRMADWGHGHAGVGG
jgi:hypothetical protein